jgi:ABC-type amino acid transport substrate-binding protein
VRLLCGEPVTLSSRREVSFSLPIFLNSVSALLRTDAPAALSNALNERPSFGTPLWRGTPTQSLLQAQTFAVVKGSPAEKTLAERLEKFQLTARVAPVKDFSEGVQSVVERKASVFFGDRSLLLDAARRSGASGQLAVLERRYTFAPVAIALKRGDEDGRLAVDRALSRIYRDSAFPGLYAKWFGAPDAEATAFFRTAALPE